MDLKLDLIMMKVWSLIWRNVTARDLKQRGRQHNAKQRDQQGQLS